MWLTIDRATQYALDVTEGREIAGPYVRAACQRHLDDRRRTDIWFDYEAAEHAMRFFEEKLVLSGGQFEDRPFMLHPSQAFKIASIFGWKRVLQGVDRSTWPRRFTRAYIEEGKGNGKALALDTPVPTPTGWSTMGELQVGDYVLDENGSPVRVIGAFDVMTGHDCYEVEFGNGEIIVADAEHLWFATRHLRKREAIVPTWQIARELHQIYTVPKGDGKQIRIVDCRRVASVPVRCIRVASDAGLFLVGRSMIVTHNTPLSAGIGLYGLIADNEPGAQIYSAATTKDQADIMFQDAVAMARANEDIWGMITPKGRVHITNLAVLEDASFFRPLAKTVARSGSGPRPHFVLADELHEHPSRAVLAMLEAGFKFRRQPLLVMTTNSGSDRKSVCWEERENAIAAAGGDPERDDSFAYVCALDEGDDPLNDRGCWRKVNPLLGVILTEEYLAKAASQAKTIPGRRNGILRLHFCIWTDAETAWLPREVWEGIEDADLDLADFEGKECKLGLDLSSRNDIAAVAMVFEDGEIEDPDDPDKRLPCFAAFVHGFTPADTLAERSQIDRADYQLWAEQGYLTATPGKFIRFEHIVKYVAELQQRFNMTAVAYDRWMITRFEDDMGEAGQSFPLVEHPQGWNRRQDTPLWMPGSIERLEELILQGRLRVVVDPVLRAAVSGATFLTSASNLRRFDKASATQRIDEVIALTQAIGVWHVKAEGDETSVYERLAERSIADRRAAIVQRVAQLRQATAPAEPAEVRKPKTLAQKTAIAVKPIADTAAKFAAFLDRIRETNEREARRRLALAFGDQDDEDD